jgi:hypothetical protein
MKTKRTGVFNKLAAKVARTLSARFPKFEIRHRSESGDLEAYIPAPRKSRAGYLVVLSDKGNIWVRISAPYAFYGIDDMPELVRIVNDILSDNAFFVIVTFRRKWSETTLVRPNAPPGFKGRDSSGDLMVRQARQDVSFTEETMNGKPALTPRRSA